MNRDKLLGQVKRAVYEIEPEAEIILYGSRVRGDATSESDWDFLILLDGPVDDARSDKICHRLYEIEWDCGEVLCPFVLSRQDWGNDLYQAMPFHKNVMSEGILL